MYKITHIGAIRGRDLISLCGEKVRIASAASVDADRRYVTCEDCLHGGLGVPFEFRRAIVPQMVS